MPTPSTADTEETEGDVSGTEETKGSEEDDPTEQSPADKADRIMTSEKMQTMWKSLHAANHITANTVQAKAKSLTTEGQIQTWAAEITSTCLVTSPPSGPWLSYHRRAQRAIEVRGILI